MSNCDNCMFKDVYRDMGAIANVCTLKSDLSLAFAEYNFYSKVKCCKSFLSYKDLETFAIKFPDELKIISEFVKIKLKK